MCIRDSLSAIFARRLSRRIVEPLHNLDLDHPLDNEAYEELSPLLGRISRQHKQITTQLRELKRRTDEFTQITGSLRAVSYTHLLSVRSLL